MFSKVLSDAKSGSPTSHSPAGQVVPHKEQLLIWRRNQHVRWLGGMETINSTASPHSFPVDAPSLWYEAASSTNPSVWTVLYVQTNSPSSWSLNPISEICIHLNVAAFLQLLRLGVYILPTNSSCLVWLFGGPSGRTSPASGGLSRKECHGWVVDCLSWEL